MEVYSSYQRDRQTDILDCGEEFNNKRISGEVIELDREIYLNESTCTNAALYPTKEVNIPKQARLSRIDMMSKACIELYLTAIEIQR